MIESLLTVASIALPALRSDVRHKQELLQARRLHSAEAEHTRELLNEKMIHKASLYSKETSNALRRHNLSMEVARSLSRREALRDAWQQRTWFLQTMILIVSLVFSMVFVALTQGRVVDIAQVQYTVAVEEIDFVDVWVKLFKVLVNSDGNSFSVVQKVDSSHNNNVNMKPFSQIFGSYLWMLSTGLSIGSLIICLWLCILIQRRIGRYRVLPSLADAGSASTSATTSDDPFQKRRGGIGVGGGVFRSSSSPNGAGTQNIQSVNEKRQNDDDDDDEADTQGKGNLAVSSTVYAATGGAVDGQQDFYDEDEDEDDYFDENNNGRDHSNVGSPEVGSPNRNKLFLLTPDRRGRKNNNNNENDEEGDVVTTSAGMNTTKMMKKRKLLKKKGVTFASRTDDHLHPSNFENDDDEEEEEEIDEEEDDDWVMIDDEIQSVVNFMMTTSGGDHNNKNNVEDGKKNKNEKIMKRKEKNRDHEDEDDTNHSTPRNTIMMSTTINQNDPTTTERNDGNDDDRNSATPPAFTTKQNLENSNARNRDNSPFSPSTHKNDKTASNKNIKKKRRQKVRLTAKLIRQLNRGPTALINEDDNEDARADGGADLLMEDDFDDDDEEEDTEETEEKEIFEDENENEPFEETSKPPSKIISSSPQKKKKIESQEEEDEQIPQPQPQPQQSTTTTAFLYNCGKTHKSFNSYYDCHCEPLRKIVAYLLGFGTFCALLAGAALHSMLMKDVFQSHDVSAYFPVSLLIFVSLMTFVWAKIGASSDRLLPTSLNHGEGDFMGLTQEVREAA